MMRIKCALVTVVLFLSVTFDSLAQDKTLTKEDVSRIEDRARPHGDVSYRMTRTSLILGTSKPPVHFVQIKERASRRSQRTFSFRLEDGKLTVVDTFLIGNNIYTKKNDSEWKVSELNLDRPTKKIESAVQTPANATLNAELEKKMLEIFAAEDAIIKRFDPDAEPKATTDIPQPQPEPKDPEIVKIVHDKDRLLDKTATIYYEVDRRGKSGTGNYTMIRRIWINKNGTLAKSEYEFSSTLQPGTSMTTDVYEYDPKDLKIEAPIK